MIPSSGRLPLGMAKFGSQDEISSPVLDSRFVLTGSKASMSGRTMRKPSSCKAHAQ